MEIKAVKLYEKGFMTQPFALGGEDGVDKFDASVRYPAGTAFEDLPDDWKCPRCKQSKDKFNKA